MALAVLLIVPLAIPAKIYWELTRPLLNKHLINQYSAEYKFDPIFIMAVVRAESGFARQARSHRGAVGLMQLMPETAKEMARLVGLNPDQVDLIDPATNLRLGIRYLAYLRDEFGEDRVAVLAAYNAGPTNVRAWRQRRTLTVEQIPFPETQAFVNRVLSTFRWLKRFQKIKDTFL